MVSRESLAIDQEYTYLSDVLVNKYARVEISFGYQKLIALVIDIQAYTNQVFDYKIKKINHVVDQKALINDELFALSKYMQRKYIVSQMAAINTMLPPGLKAKDVKEASSLLYLVYQDNPIPPKESLLEAKEYLENSKIVLNSEFVKLFSASKANTLVRNGYAIKEKRAKSYYLIDESIKDLKVLNKDQQQAYTDIIESKQTTTLLHGVTGSGKTEIFLHLAKHYLDKGQSVLILVPEITLTLMMMKRFASVFDNNLAILHSKLSANEKYQEYQKIVSGQVKLVVGTRSAVFAPLNNIGIIILDEEHDTSYHQQSQVMYSTHDIAIERATYYQGKVLLASATPSIVSYTKAMKGLYQYLFLESRFNYKDLPQIQVIDMAYENIALAVSQTSLDTIQSFLDRKKQVIVLINRRGYHNFYQCRSCKEVIACPHCEIPLTYHKKNDKLVCHYCNYTLYHVVHCPTCQSNDLKKVGMGSQKIEEFLQESFENYRIGRIDLDSTKNVATLESVIESFGKGEIDILVGTQMIAKGLDFSNADLVVVLNIDASLAFNFYDANEKAYQLLVQVSGRAGRHSGQGQVLIETFNPSNYIIQSAISNNYLNFYSKEMIARREAYNPPFYYQAKILVNGKDQGMVDGHSNLIEDGLKKYFSEIEDVHVNRDFSSILKVNNHYQKGIVLKYKEYDKVYPILYELKKKYASIKAIGLSIDTNY